MTTKAAPYEVLSAEDSGPFIFNSPHSGRDYSTSFLNASRLDPRTIRKSEDCFVEELFDAVVSQGATLMYALFPRAFLDVNREPFELDPLLFTDGLPAYANTRSIRVLGGLGTIARVVADSEEIYEVRPSIEEAMARIQEYYWPYHHALKRLLDHKKERWGYAVLLDCHSMPSQGSHFCADQQPDFVLGDRFNTSCARVVTDLTEDILSSLGYRVLRNSPYSGGYVTEHYGRPELNVHGLQIEINRRIYMDEENLEKSDGFDSLQENLAVFSHRLISELPGLLSAPPMAAE